MTPTLTTPTPPGVCAVEGNCGANTLHGDRKLGSWRAGMRRIPFIVYLLRFQNINPFEKKLFKEDRLPILVATMWQLLSELFHFFLETTQSHKENETNTYTCTKLSLTRKSTNYKRVVHSPRTKQNCLGKL